MSMKSHVYGRTLQRKTYEGKWGTDKQLTIDGKCIRTLCTYKRKLVVEDVRIDNSHRGRIHGIWNISRSTKARTSCDISNERADFSSYLGVSGI